MKNILTKTNQSNINSLIKLYGRVQGLLFILLILLTLISPAVAFSSDMEDIIKQQKSKAAKEKENKNREEEKQKAIAHCINEFTKVVAAKIKELMNAGIKFEKNPGIVGYKNEGGQRYANLGGGMYILLLTSMLEDSLLVMSSLSTHTHITIMFQPENGESVRMYLKFQNDGKWEVETFFGLYEKPKDNITKFKSYFDVEEIEKKRDRIYKNIVEAIKAAVEQAW